MTQAQGGGGAGHPERCHKASRPQDSLLPGPIPFRVSPASPHPVAQTTCVMTTRQLRVCGRDSCSRSSSSLHSANEIVNGNTTLSISQGCREGKTSSFLSNALKTVQLRGGLEGREAAGSAGREGSAAQRPGRKGLREAVWDGAAETGFRRDPGRKQQAPSAGSEQGSTKAELERRGQGQQPGGGSGTRYSGLPFPPTQGEGMRLRA